MHIAIVGGGVGGMTAALLLRRRGMRVTLYERQPRLGGRLAYETGGGYRIDQGPTIVLLPEMLLGILEEAGIPRSRVPLVPCDPMYRIHYADGTVLHKWRDPDRQAAELERLSPGEGAGFLRYIRDMERGYREGKAAFLDRPFLRRRDFYTAGNLALLTRLKAYKSVRGLAADYFRDERLRDAYSLQTLYIGGAPFQSPGLYTLLPYAEHAYGVWYLKGGYAALVPILERELREQGVEVRLDAPVEQLWIEEERAAGVYCGGERVRYDGVVYNGDYPGIGALLGDAGGAGQRRRYTPSSGCVLIYLGLDRQWPKAAAHQFFLPRSLTAGLRRIFGEGQLPDDPSFYAFYPGALDSDAAPPGGSVLYLLVPAPPAGRLDWSAVTPPLVRHVLAEAERRGFPGLRQAIRWQSVRTPADAAAEGLYQGGSFGIAPTLTQSAVFRPQIASSAVKGLYAVGASVHPGGGVPIVMQGARLLADHLTKGMNIWNWPPHSQAANR
ncbi:phytoene desaturase family protein [Paenibacillus sabuli]|nr:phytoene desaturase family protein [Paenibacillus sabuli]